MTAQNMVDRLAAAYDALADSYAAGRHLFDTTPILRRCAGLLAGRARVLDAGCGAGEPVARFFVDRGDEVTGIDVSERMLEIARRQVPEARFRHLDLRSLDFPAGSFDLLAAVYCVFHLPRTEHGALFEGFARVLAPHGLLLLTLATREYTGADEFDGELDFLGQRLPYSHDRPEVALDKLRRAGLDPIAADRIETGGETFLWVIARKRGPEASPPHR
ncbi:methyltransferase [Thioalkalivibrio nitratireducens DSM 14787]|uniref:Methyltransferase n=1 Tax=Thioalkalivibrio nitratireducens (strain DSM 14787 / UNIQEM 213 / ALEN2) TaxID=1255043 RepID=L0DWK8_THIND|nr:class I SAM-dependent methyltransferase [Thioalkalivibrio nitratireducens]AGA33979.1 methyltransferase [Thioalkalivibrio nitratireducens DSM 14787]